MKRSRNVVVLFLWLYFQKSHAGTAGPSKDEIYLLIIPLFILILFAGIPPLYRFIKGKIKELKERHQLAEPENGFPEF